ncbi:hypothetical protein [Streptomyces syringium]|uniref:hypothetical protein n=1 Tax=Streptomyces syringium TaxID=76729 RepID=UPI0037CFC398
MTVTGAHLDGISAVTFGGAATTGLHVRSATELTVKTPLGAATAQNPGRGVRRPGAGR